MEMGRWGREGENDKKGPFEKEGGGENCVLGAWLAPQACHVCGVQPRMGVLGFPFTTAK